MIVTIAFATEAAINAIAGIWWLINPVGQLKLIFPDKYLTQNPAFLLISKWWGGALLIETVLLFYGIFNLHDRMMIYVVLLCGELFIIVPTIQYMLQDSEGKKMRGMLISLFVFALIRIALMVAISYGVT